LARNINGAEYGKLLIGSGRTAHNSWVERMGTPRGIAAAMYPQFRDSTVFIEDDFLEDTLFAPRWNLAADGTATTFAWAAAAGGTIQGATGTTGNGYFGINGDVLWSGDKNAGCAIRFKLDVVTGFTFELGFTDALSDETLPAVTDVDTPATGNGATDVAVIHLDTAQTLTTAAFVGESTGSVYAAQKSNLGTWTPTAAKWYTAIVQLIGDTAMCAVYNTDTAASPILQAGTNKSLILALEGGTLVRPHFLFGTRNTTSKVVDVDLLRVWQDR
jgi:hypothetical protein